MAGVARPIIRKQTFAAVRFLAGFAFGALAAALVLGVCAVVVGTLLQALLPIGFRVMIVGGFCAALGAADLLNRTPHMWRQVPQEFARTLPMGFLGLTWGFDIGLLFTTQKVASLMWAAIAAVVLLRPADAPVLLVSMALLSAATIGLSTARSANSLLNHGTRWDRRWLRIMRAGSGSLLLAVAAFTIIGTFPI